MRFIQPAGSTRPGQTGVILSVNLSDARIAKGNEGENSDIMGNPRAVASGGQRPLGLFLAIRRNVDPTDPDDVAPDEARALLTVGYPFGGAEETRTFIITPQGLWLSVADWASCELKILEVTRSTAAGSRGTLISYAWTSQQPSGGGYPMQLIEVIAAGADQVIPQGAVEVALDAPDAGWVWAGVTGGKLSIAQPQLGLGTVNRVIGTTFDATVVNRAVWFLRAP